MSNKNKDKDREWKLYTKAYELASRTGQIKTGTYGDPEQSGILDNYYHLISTEGKLLARFSIDQMRASKSIGNGCGSGCAWFMLGGGVTLATLIIGITLPVLMESPPAGITATNRISIIAKECAAKIADGQINPTFIVPEVNGYKFKKNNNAGFYLENNRKLSGSTINCPTKGKIKIVSEDESKNPTFSYNLDTGKKVCTAESGTEAEKLCSNGTW